MDFTASISFYFKFHHAAPQRNRLRVGFRPRFNADANTSVGFETHRFVGRKNFAIEHGFIDDSAAKQSDEARLGEVFVVSQNFQDVALLHYEKRIAVGYTPFFIWAVGI